MKVANILVCALVVSGVGAEVQAQESQPVQAKGAAESTPPDEEKVKAAALFREANGLAKRKLYLDALKKYRAARALFPSYKIDLNIGGVLDAMGRHADAAAQFERFLLGSTEAPPEIIAQARQRLAHLREHLASVKVECLEEDAVVNVSGKDAGKTPMDLPHYVDPGKHKLKVSKAGFLIMDDDLELSPGQHVAQNIRLRSVAASKAYVDYKARLEERERKTRISLITLGVGAGVAGAAVALYAIGGSQGARAEERFNTAVWPEDIEDAEEDAAFARDIMIGGHVAIGVAAGVLGYSLYNFLTRPSDEKPEEPGMTPMPLISLGGQPGGGQVTLSGRF